MINELSAMVLSRKAPGHLIGCNDEDGPFYYIRIEDNTVVSQFFIKPKTRDTESLSLDPLGRLWIGDTGNNKNKFKNVICHVLPEPGLGKHPKPYAVETHKYKWPKQRKENCEAMLINPESSFLRFVSKAPVGTLYVPQGGKLVPYKHGFPRYVTDGTYGIDGRRAYFTRKEANDVTVYDTNHWDVMGSFPVPHLPQCESITAVDSTRLIIGSEGAGHPIKPVTIPEEYR